jgi:hypothetical protein
MGGGRHPASAGRSAMATGGRSLSRTPCPPVRAARRSRSTPNLSPTIGDDTADDHWTAVRPFDRLARGAVHLEIMAFDELVGGPTAKPGERPWSHATRPKGLVGVGSVARDWHGRGRNPCSAKPPALQTRTARIQSRDGDGIRRVRERGRSSGVEHNLAKVGVEGSNPFARSKYIRHLPHSGGANELRRTALNARTGDEQH